MTTADLQAAERAYQRTRRDDRQGASVKRKAAVRAALDAGWTHRAVAEAMGKSTGWVGQLLTVKAPEPSTARTANGSDLERHERRVRPMPQQIASTTAPQQDRPKAIDRFRKAQA